MRAFTAGRFSFHVPLAGVESLKWFALVCMLQEHILRLAFGVYPLTSYVLGRLAFPLFAIAICRATAEVSPRLITRLFLWGSLSVAARFFFDVEPWPLNVLFTFLLGLLASTFVRAGGVWWFGAAACVACGSFVEFGMPGVAFVLLLKRYFERLEFWLLISAAFALWLFQQAYMPLAAFLIAPLLARTAAEVPRVRGVFYWVYAVQWPVIAVMRYAF